MSDSPSQRGDVLSCRVSALRYQAAFPLRSGILFASLLLTHGGAIGLSH